MEMKFELKGSTYRAEQLFNAFNDYLRDQLPFERYTELYERYIQQWRNAPLETKRRWIEY